jgi:hypothetical protein
MIPENLVSMFAPRPEKMRQDQPSCGYENANGMYLYRSYCAREAGLSTILKTFFSGGHGRLMGQFHAEENFVWTKYRKILCANDIKIVVTYPF